jgi:uncharacterized membrane protein YjjP (DUF1212 family)
MIIYLARQVYKLFDSSTQDDDNNTIKKNILTEKDNSSSSYGTTGTDNLKEGETNEPEPTFCQMCYRFAISLFDWTVLIAMSILPAITGNWAAVFGISFALGVIFLGFNGYRYYWPETIKIFPKVFEIGMLSINFGLLMFEVIEKPSTSWSLNWTSIIVNICLLGLVVVSALIGKPFTLQFAMEKVPESYWKTELFLRINYHIAFVWGLNFALSIGFGLIAIYLAENDPYVRIIPSIIVLVGAFTFTSSYPKFAREREAKKQQLQQQSNSRPSEIQLPSSP